MGNCPDRIEGETVQSPLNVQSVTSTPWSSQDVAFFTAWQEASITADKHYFSNYVYRIEATYGNLGLFYATEPFPNAAQITWQVDQIRFHYPAEHSLNEETFDLEMQIVMNDISDRCQWCTSGNGVLSLFFNVGETENSFWNWVGQTEFNLDLDLVFTKTSPI